MPVEEAEIGFPADSHPLRLSAKPWPYLEIGERIRIEDEAFHGLEGVLVNFKGSHRIVVWFPCCGVRWRWKLIVHW